MNHLSKMETQKARRESLLQRNMLLSMRLNNRYNSNGVSPKRNAPLRPIDPTRKTWRMTHSPQKSIPAKKPLPLSRSNRHMSAASSKNEKSGPHTAVLSDPPHQQTGQGHQEGLSSSKAKVMSLDDFEIGKKLGKGKFGRVYCVKHKKTGFVCAMKAMEKKALIQYNVQKQFRREVEIQSSLNHPNLTKLYGFFHDEKRVYLLMEYPINGELYRRLRVRGPLNDILASHYVYQMADALDFLQQRNVIHRDIKPENILIGFNDVIKLTDFGSSVVSPRGVKRQTLCGTIDYLSPELISKREYDNKVDIWALGVLAYELITSSPPFEEESSDLTNKRILKGDIKFPESVSSDARDLISKLLRHKPTDRILLKDVKNHPWILKNKPFW